MDKQKQIEEMARDMCGISYTSVTGDCVCGKLNFECHCNCKHFERAKRLYNAGYRKIPEIPKDTVLTGDDIAELLTVVAKDTRKETAEKIFDKLYTWLDLEEIEKYGFVHIQKFDFLRKYREIREEIINGAKTGENSTGGEIPVKNNNGANTGDLCVVCGDYVMEGRHVCVNCEKTSKENG